MSWRIILAIVLFAAGAYTSIGFLIDSWEGRLCWELGSGTYVRLPYWTSLSKAVGALVERVSRSPFTASFELLVMTAFLWPIAALLLSRRIVLALAAALVILLPFALILYDQTAFGFALYCNNDGMAELGFAIMQLLVIPATILVLLAAHLIDRIEAGATFWRASAARRRRY